MIRLLEKKIKKIDDKSTKNNMTSFIPYTLTHVMLLSPLRKGLIC